MATKKKNAHYVDNKEFSLAVVDYVRSADTAKAAGKPVPVVTNYVAKCFMLIAEGLSHRPNFITKPYREEMVMDAVENCLRAINNYNVEVATRGGLPNAFGYFNQISYFAFIRRINKEKALIDIKMAVIESHALDEMLSGVELSEGATANQDYVDYVNQKRKDGWVGTPGYRPVIENKKKKKKETNSDLEHPIKEGLEVLFKSLDGL